MSNQKFDVSQVEGCVGGWDYDGHGRPHFERVNLKAIWVSNPKQAFTQLIG